MPSETLFKGRKDRQAGRQACSGRNATKKTKFLDYRYVEEKFSLKILFFYFKLEVLFLLFLNIYSFFFQYISSRSVILVGKLEKKNKKSNKHTTKNKFEDFLMEYQTPIKNPRP